MKKLPIVLMLMFCSAFLLFAGEGEMKKSHRFYDLNGIASGEGTLKYSIFGQTTYGISDAVEISAHPVIFFLSPSVDVKYTLMTSDQYSVAGVSGISYPTLLMRLVAAKGIGGFISPEFTIPHMFSVRSGVVATLPLGEQHFISGSVLFECALNNSSLEPGSSIDLPLIAPRDAIYYKNAGFTAAVASEGENSAIFDYHMKIELFLFPFPSKRYDNEYTLGQQDIFSETTGNILWKITETSRLSPGFKLTYGDYPFGGQWHLFPVIDFVKWIE